MAAVLVLNAGSSTVKYQVVDPRSGDAAVKGVVDHADEIGYDAALATVERELADAGIGGDDLVAVGHRVVHGGAVYSEPAVIDDAVVATIDELSDLAPLHNPPAVAGIREARTAFPGLPHVAVFDTAFFSGLPEVAATYAIDREVAAGHGLRRYGAHGTSHLYVSRAAADFVGRPLGDVDQIVLHLGGGASASAISGGRPVDTSMGLTPLEGLVMGTRGGDLDPGALLRLLRCGSSVEDLDDLLHHHSGLLGMAGTSDFRALEERRAAGDEVAELAFAVYVHRLRKYVGAYLAVLGGADIVTFTGGVGEHSAAIRAGALERLEPLGLAVDPARNEAADDGPRVISPDGSRVTVLVVPTNEEWEIARQVMRLLAEPSETDAEPSESFRRLGEDQGAVRARVRHLRAPR